MDDPIVEEVRKARDEYARQFGYDLKAICQDLKKRQDAGGREVVSFAEERNEETRVEVEK